MKNDLNCEEIRELCIKNRWFTCGSILQYAKLFERVREGAELSEIITIIWICSDKTKEEINHEIMIAEEMKYLSAIREKKVQNHDNN